jgi:hypothetical protein
MNKNFIYYSIILLLIFSCNKEKTNCFKSTGKEIKIIREISPFSKLNIYDKINVVLVNDNRNYLEITGGENILDGIYTEVNEGELTIKNNNTCNFLRSFKKNITVTVHFTTLNKIEYFGAGMITNTDTLVLPELEIETRHASGDVTLLTNIDSLRIISHVGVSNFYLSGNTNYFYAYSIGASIIRAENLQSGFVHINNGSMGDFYVYPINKLHVEVRSYANNYYRGSPSEITAIYSGSGKVLQMD